MTAAVALAVGRPGLGGVLLGGGVIGVSVHLYAAAVRVLLRRAPRRLAIGLVFAKLLLFLGLGALVVAAGEGRHPDPVGFAVGLTCFPAAAVWEAMRVRGR
jgi:hypothetical protein